MKIENYLLNIILFLFRSVSMPFKKNGAYFATCASSKRLQDKKSNLIKFSFYWIIMFQMASYGQNIVPFTKRYNQQIKGDMLVIGNNIF
jgi:hypothetical protein